jgi:hypothetical protein
MLKILAFVYKQGEQVEGLYFQYAQTYKIPQIKSRLPAIKTLFENTCILPDATPFSLSHGI